MDFSRQSRIFNPEEQKSKITIIGCGSTGSFIGLTLAKLGFNEIKVIDFDKVEEQNIPNQFYRINDIGKPKVEALKEIVMDFTGTELETENIKVEKDYEFDLSLDSIIIFCVDNMEARRLIYDKIKDFPIMLIDTRMGGVGFDIYVVDLSDEEQKKVYETRLGMTTLETVCGEKATIYTILAIASETCQIVKNIDRGEAYPHVLKRGMSNYMFLTDLK